MAPAVIATARAAAPRSTGPTLPGGSITPPCCRSRAGRCRRGPSTARCRRRAARSVWQAPAVIAVAGDRPPRFDGSARPGSSPSPIEAVAPLPSWPNSPRPQQRTVPLSSTAHVWLPPAVIAVAVRPGPMSTGPSALGDLVVADVVAVAVAELALVAVAPAAHGAVVEHRAGVVVADRERLRGAPGAEVDGPGRRGRLVVADDAEVAVAELAVAAEAPAAHRHALPAPA